MIPQPSPSGLPDTRERFIVHRWDDPVVESLGFAVNSIYTETVLLPILGPSATWCLRRLGAWAEAHPNGVEVDTGELARDLGLGQNLAKNSPINRTLNRLCQFDMAQWDGTEWLAVRTSVAPIPERQVARLTPAVAHVHHLLVSRAAPAHQRAKAMIETAEPIRPPIEPAVTNGAGIGL